MNFIDRLVRSNTYKNIMAKLYGWGAAVVIFGALFKILHLPGANIMLIIGMGTEVAIFFFSAFEKRRAYPQGKKERGEGRYAYPTA